MAGPAIYVCTNERCPLGPHGQPGGRFVGGITKEGLNLLTGRPVDDMKQGEDYGPGFCTNCGQEGEEYDATAEALASIDAQIAALRDQKKELES